MKFGSKMVKGSTGTLTMRLVRSKLRKPDELRSDSKNTSEVKEQYDNDDGQTENRVKCCDAQTPSNKDNQHVTFVRSSGVTTESVGHVNVTDISEWTFPPKAPSPHIYHLNPELLVANEKASFRGFRKQFSGRFKRLVARKFETAPVIPPELKPQLKTIYVY